MRNQYYAAIIVEAHFMKCSYLDNFTNPVANKNSKFSAVSILINIMIVNIL